VTTVDGSTEPDRASVLGWVGRLGAPILAVAVYALLPGSDAGMSPAARATAAVAALMAVLWLTEGLPLAVTALLPIVLFPLFGVLEIGKAAAPYAHPFIFLFLGGFLIALAIERWNLHRRIALLTVLAVGTRPARLVGGFMLATAFLSMWISNTATTVMMLPIGLSVIALVSERLGEAAGTREAAGPSGGASGGAANFPVCLMLGIAYAASIGGLGTLVGSPPNLILAGIAKDSFNVEITFAAWLSVGLPVAAVFLVLAWLWLVKVVYPIRIKAIPGGRKLIREELAKLGPMSRGEWSVLAVFVPTAIAWIVREPLSHWTWLAQRVPAVERVHDATIALAGAVLLFVIPADARRGQFVLDWKTATKVPWGVLLLFGGGLSLAAGFEQSGLSAWIGHQVAVFDQLPLVLLVLLTTGTILLLTELTSNTATANVFLPILGAAALGLGLDPMVLLLPAGMAASCAFMMPVATPPNAIVFGSGHVRIGQMVKAGVWLNLIGLAVVTALTFLLRPWVLP